MKTCLLCALLIILTHIQTIITSEQPAPTHRSKCFLCPARRSDNPQDVALLQAAREGNIGHVQQLINSGANINYQDQNGWSPLIAAAKLGHNNIAQLLLTQQNQQINANLEANSGRTALIAAANEGHAPIVLTLIQSRLANLDHQDKEGWTALIAAGYKQHDLIIKILIANGANYRLRTRKNQSFVDIIESPKKLDSKL